MTEKVIRKGGAFLVEETPAKEVFTPEDFREEHKMIIVTTEDFVKNEVAPYMEALEHKDYGVARRLMQKAGELGLLGADVPEEYGGGGLGIIASLLICEHSVGSGSFNVTLNAHTGIGTTPLVFFGTRSQKEKYLPPLARGEKVAAYALTEPGAGTDALSLRTTAVLSPDGKYYKLNGTKQFITNGGYADIIITYAKVGGDKMTAFVLERGFPGISTGPEEKKMGIRGTSTVSIILEDVRVPAENVIFQVGKGHTVAFNILDLGRFKLASGSLGVAKLALESSVKYAKERVQFGKPICQFGLIKHKIAEMAIKTYMAESMLYRTGGLVETILETVDRSAEDVGRQSAKSLSEYAVECSINKVYASEIVDYVADEAVQIHGGYGFIEDYMVERIYRDSRILRIFEGTNEINRLITVAFLMRKALKNEIPLLAAMEKLQKEMPGIKPVSPEIHDGPLGYQRQLIDRAKKAFLVIAGAAVGKYGEAISEEEEIIGCLADIAIEAYAMESGLLRALKSIEGHGQEASKTKIDMVKIYVNDAMARVIDHARMALAAVETGEALHKQLVNLTNLTQFAPMNTVAARRSVADKIIAAEKFIC
ncbi:MAG: acyl-CoA dehydrogenase family protein [Chloroflexi bacterium]|nr:acyl-CoA dehydrogenase family protein [Chloroflexota bacterium]